MPHCVRANANGGESSTILMGACRHVDNTATCYYVAVSFRGVVPTTAQVCSRDSRRAGEMDSCIGIQILKDAARCGHISA